MIIVSSRKFRDNQNTYFEKANTEEVILQTLRYGSFRLVPVREGDVAFQDVRRASEEKNAALAANFHKGERALRVPESPIVAESAPSPSAVDIAELVKTAVREAVAAAVPAAAAAAAAAQVQQLQQEIVESRPQRTPRTPRKSSSATKEKPDRLSEPQDIQTEPAKEYGPLFAEEKPEGYVGEAAPTKVAEVFAQVPQASAPGPEIPEQAAPVTPPASAKVSASEPVRPAVPDGSVRQESASEPARLMSARPAPNPIQPRQIPGMALSVEDELEHEPIPEPSEEVRRHIHPVQDASADVKPDFVDPSLYADYEDSYIVGEERPDLEAQLEAYRKQEKGGFFRRLFKK